MNYFDCVFDPMDQNQKSVLNAMSVFSNKAPRPVFIRSTVYVHPVKGFEPPGAVGKILLLKKALYGTKQAAHAWQTFLAGIFCEIGAKRHVKDDCVYVFQEGVLFLSGHTR